MERIVIGTKLKFIAKPTHSTSTVFEVGNFYEVKEISLNGENRVPAFKFKNVLCDDWITERFFEFKSGELGFKPQTRPASHFNREIKSINQIKRIVVGTRLEFVAHPAHYPNDVFVVGNIYDVEEISLHNENRVPAFKFKNIDYDWINEIFFKEI